MTSTPFELEWMGGPPEHHFRKARPGIDELPWGTITISDFDPRAVDRARGSWTEVAINEYRAITAFSDVLRALVETKAPLDLLGMTSDFLADECSHVELASRMAMELGGAAPRLVDLSRLNAPARGRTAFERANELVLRTSCIAEAFSGGTASVSREHTSHPLPHAIYDRILREESRHRRLGGLYFEWAIEKIDDAERTRLGRILAAGLKSVAPFWKPKKPFVDPPPWSSDHLQALGWLGPKRFAPIAREVVLRDVVEPLKEIGIELTDEERRELFDD
ncbi:MAG TPA: hypothetical protein VF407_13600 [Polyangiaceae bacterium]